MLKWSSSAAHPEDSSSMDPDAFYPALKALQGKFREQTDALASSVLPSAKFASLHIAFSIASWKRGSGRFPFLRRNLLTTQRKCDPKSSHCLRYRIHLQVPQGVDSQAAIHMLEARNRHSRLPEEWNFEKEPWPCEKR